MCSGLCPREKVSPPCTVPITQWDVFSLPTDNELRNIKCVLFCLSDHEIILFFSKKKKKWEQESIKVGKVIGHLTFRNKTPWTSQCMSFPSLTATVYTHTNLMSSHTHTLESGHLVSQDFSCNSPFAVASTFQEHHFAWMYSNACHISLFCICIFPRLLVRLCKYCWNQQPWLEVHLGSLPCNTFTWGTVWGVYSTVKATHTRLFLCSGLAGLLITACIFTMPA